MATFNPKILDASIRDVASCLTDNEKADLLLHAVKKLSTEGSSRTKTVIENAIQSCLSVSTLSLESKANARVLRAKARLASGSSISGIEDLQAALMADPDNVEAKALLHARSQTIDKLLTPAATVLSTPESPFQHGQPFTKQLQRVSIEIWREVALFLPRRDLKSLLFVPHILSRVASQLLFRELDLHFCGEYGGGAESDDEGGSSILGPGGGMGVGNNLRDREAIMEERERDEGRHAQRTADILTRLIVDQKFANAVRTLKIYCSSRRDRDGSMAFQTGMLMNVLPKLVNLKNIYLSAPSESIVPVLRILQTTGTKLHGLSLHSPDAPAELAFLELRNLSHFSYTTSGGNLANVTPLLTPSRTSLSSLSLETTHSSPSPHWTFPNTYISIRNLTSLNFTGHFSKEHGAAIIGEILRDGRQIENLSIVCCALESGGMSREFKNASAGWEYGGGESGAQHVSLNTNGTPVALPFLRNFAFTVSSIGRRTSDRELFGSIADFLRGRRSLRSLKLMASCDEHVQAAVGFSAAVWGVLPSLEGLRGLAITYPGDLTAGLAPWLVPRSVRALTLSLDYANATARDPVGFLSSLRQGMPPDLRFIGLSELNVRHASLIVEQGFPTVRVVRVGQSYWTVHHRKYGGSGYSSLGSSPPLGAPSMRQLLPSMSSHMASPSGLSSPGGSTHPPHSATTSGSNSRGTLSPPGGYSDRGGERLNASGTMGNERLLHLIRPLTHTGHPHSGHTHGHPGSINPHTPHAHAHLLNPTPAPGPSSGSGTGGLERGADRYTSGSGSYGGSSGGLGSSHSGGLGSGLHQHNMGPPSSGGPSSLLSTGILGTSIGGGISPGAGAGAGTTVLDLEPWPRRAVMYHLAEWLEWLGCEDVLVRDQSAFPAWTMCL